MQGKAYQHGSLGITRFRITRLFHMFAMLLSWSSVFRWQSGTSCLWTLGAPPLLLAMERTACRRPIRMRVMLWSTPRKTIPPTHPPPARLRPSRRCHTTCAVLLYDAAAFTVMADTPRRWRLIQRFTSHQTMRCLITAALAAPERAKGRRPGGGRRRRRSAGSGTSRVFLPPDIGLSAVRGHPCRQLPLRAFMKEAVVFRPRWW